MCLQIHRRWCCSCARYGHRQWKWNTIITHDVTGNWIVRHCPICLTRYFADMVFLSYPLTHWGRITHICVSKLIIIGSDNGLSLRRHAIIWTNAGILLIRTAGTNFSKIVSEIYIFSFEKIHLKMFAKWRQFCLDLNVLNLEMHITIIHVKLFCTYMVGQSSIFCVLKCTWQWQMSTSLFTGSLFVEHCISYKLGQSMTASCPEPRKNIPSSI